MVTLLLERSLGVQIPAMRRILYDDGIDTRPFFHPLSSLPAYAESPQAAAGRKRNLVSYDLASRGMNLPSALALEGRDIERVSDAVRKAISSAGPQICPA